MHVHVLTPAQAVEAGIRLARAGHFTKPRGLGVYEVNNVTLEVEQPWQLPIRLTGRQLRSFIGAAEALQLVGQTSVPEHMVENVKAFGKFTDGGIFHGAYGPRVAGRLEALVRLLRKDLDTRQAILTIYDSRQDLGAEVRDVPCTLSLQFFVRDGRLCLRTSMRSNDVWLGLPYDLTQFIALQGAVAADLGLPLGWYSHTVGSLHIYQPDLEAAEQVKAPSAKSTAPVNLWMPSPIGEISSRARQYLVDGGVNPNHMRSWGAPDFEVWLALHGGRHD